MKTEQNEEIRTEERREWTGRYRDVSFRISLHAVGERYTPGSEGIWCFYVFLNEQAVPNFSALWLEDKVYRYKPDAPGRITHDYMASIPSGIEFHGGITYYAKHGHTEGFRCVELGCDYNHLWDSERGGGYTLEEIKDDVKRCIDSIYTTGLLKPQS